MKRTIYRCVMSASSREITISTVTGVTATQLQLIFVSNPMGVDFAGSLFVKSIYQPHRNQLYKAHICLLTCTTSRAVHLEPVPDLEGQTFIRALTRFIARRGYPRILVSDNAETFTSCVLKTFF